MTKEQFIKRALEVKKEPSEAMYTIMGLEVYRDQFYSDPKSNWPENEFEDRCVAIWVIDEVIVRIRKNPEIDPSIIAEQFLLELIDFMNKTDNYQREKMFRTASYIAEEIVDYMHCMF